MPRGVQELRHRFRVLVVDPPFITPETWKKYANDDCTVACFSSYDRRVSACCCGRYAETVRLLVRAEPQRLLCVAWHAPHRPGATPHAVWQAAPGARFILTTTLENRALVAELLGVTQVPFRPCIPNLVYQYELYTNFSSRRLSQPNPEVPSEPSA
jgi:hypothetical protein